VAQQGKLALSAVLNLQAVKRGLVALPVPADLAQQRELALAEGARA
jgi:hypothetical protein